MLRPIKKFLELKKFIKFADSIGYNLKDPHPIESLAFQTVASIKLNPIKDFSLKRNDLTIYDTIIFTLFVLRILCIAKIDSRTKAEEFSDAYISKVLDFFPEWRKISNKYDPDYFDERVKYYDFIYCNDSLTFNERMDKIVSTFEAIITYDYMEEYVRFNENTPLMIVDFTKHFKISTEVKMFYGTFPNLFGGILSDVSNLYN